MQSPCSHMPIILPASNKTPTIILDILYKIDMHVSKLLLPRNLRGLKKVVPKIQLAKNEHIFRYF